MVKNELQTTVIENAIKALKECVSTMEMQEKRETEEFHITPETALCIWNATKERASRAIDGLNLL
jgi:hypothetical protein